MTEQERRAEREGEVGRAEARMRADHAWRTVTDEEQLRDMGLWPIPKVVRQWLAAAKREGFKEGQIEMRNRLAKYTPFAVDGIHIKELS